MSNKINFNDHLDDMMERLMNEDLSSDQLDLEIRRSKALCQIAEKKISDKKMALEFVLVVSKGDIDERMIPVVFGEEFKRIGDHQQKKSNENS
ncbi:hypothetical protein V2E39_17220 [Chryseobacterium arthrosphaerae]|uniref:Uncharacterized protein n=1 Tax=Chryseobacterium arthrosphaerae TaxID=651561 RepID=A0ABU7R2V0_9FLAO